MIRVSPAPEPADFAERVGEPGERVLRELRGDPAAPRRRGPKRRQLDPSIWARILPDLRRVYHRRCAYTALLVFPEVRDSVDHFKPKENERFRDLAYTWGNYRYALLDANRIKGADEVLDPFEVQDDWFSLNLDSFKVETTESFPSHLRPLWEATERIVNDPMFCDGRRWRHEAYFGRAAEPGLPAVVIDLATLELQAPMVARALRSRGLLRDEDRPSDLGMLQSQ